VADRVRPTVTPDDPRILAAIEALLS
jgi:hypothetical protein